MAHDSNHFKEPTRVIEEIEGQLEKLLQQRVEDVEKDLAARISQEKEAARKRKEDIEREFDKERQALSDYRAMIRASEAERTGLLEEARQRLKKVMEFQAEIEGLAKSTVGEINNVNAIQRKLEDLRTRTAESASFLKKDLRDRFGIMTEVPGQEAKAISLDLDQELEKLRKVKELLSMESAAAGLDIGMGESADKGELTPPETEADTAGVRIPEIQELIAASAAVEVPETPPATMPEPIFPEVPVAEPEPQPAPPAAPDGSETSLLSTLEGLRRTEPANGNGEIHYFQKDKRILIDGEKLFAAVDKTLEEAQKLSQKLGMTESPKDQFFIKQELINWQEGLRALFLRIIKMCEKSVWRFPRFTAEIINTQNLRGLLERLSMENWSNSDEFASFSASLQEMKTAFFARIDPRLPYLRSLRDELLPE